MHSPLTTVGLVYLSRHDYAVLGMSLQLEWQYLQRTVPGVGALMGPIEQTLRERLPPVLFGGDEIGTNFWQILGHSVKHGGLGMPLNIYSH